MVFSTIPRPFKLRGKSRKGLDDDKPGYLDCITPINWIKIKIYNKDNFILE